MWSNKRNFTGNGIQGRCRDFGIWELFAQVGVNLSYLLRFLRTMIVTCKTNSYSSVITRKYHLASIILLVHHHNFGTIGSPPYKKWWNIRWHAGWIDPYMKELNIIFGQNRYNT